MPASSCSASQDLSAYLRRTCHLNITKLFIYVRRVSDVLRTEDWLSVEDVQTSVETVWKVITNSAQKPLAFPKVLRLLLEAVFLMEFFRYDSYRHYKTLNEIIDHNKKIRDLEKSKGSATSTRPVKLNFDGEVEEVASVPSQKLMNDTVNLDDERKLQLPLTAAFQALRTIFMNDTWKTAIVDANLVTSEFATEAVHVLVYMSSFFQLHRMSHDALLAAKLAFSLTSDISLPVQTTLSVGISYMMCLLPARLYATAACVLEKTTEIASCEEDWKANYPLQFAMLMAQGAWMMLLKQQVADLEMAFGAVKFCSDLPELQEGDKSLVKGVYLRLLANLCVIYRSLDQEDQNSLASIIPRTVSPLWLLEEAKTQLTSNFYEGSSSGWAGLARLYRKIEHFDLIENISNLYLSIGAPAEAWAYISYGYKLSKREFSCRWILVFLDLQARSYYNNEGISYYEKFQSTVFEMDRVILISNASVLPRLRARAPLEEMGGSIGEINDLSAAVGRIGIGESDTNTKTGEESSSASGIEDEEWATVKHVAKLPILDASLHPQKGDQECLCRCCVDLDLHGALMKTILLRFTALKAGKLRDAMLKRACEIHDILNRKKVILKTFDDVDNPLSQLSSPISAPFFRFRFDHAAHSFLNFRRSTTFDDAVKRLVEKFPDFTVLYPDIVAQSRYLVILCKIIEELPNAKALKDLLNGSCGYRSNGMNTTGSEFIDDHLTAMVTKSSGKSNFARPVTPEGKPANAAVLHMENQKREKNEARHRRRINRNEEPTIPGDLAREAEEQSRMIANRRKTMWQDTVNLSSNSTIVATGTDCSAASSKSLQSDKVQRILDLIDVEIARMTDFPLFPYFRNLVLLRCLMTEYPCTSERYVTLSAAGVGAKFNHQLLSFRNQADRVSFDNVMEYCVEGDITEKSDYISRLPAVNINLLPENWVVCGISLVTKPTLPVFGETSADLLYVMITRWERGIPPIIMRVPVRSSQAGIIQSLQDIHKKAMNNQNHHKNNRDYWTTRLILNNEVAQLTEAMERILGPARVLLLSSPTGEAEKNALDKRVKSLRALATRNSIQIDASLLRLIVLTGIYLSTEEHLKFTADLLDCSESSREVVTVVQSLRKTPFCDNLSYSRCPVVLIPDNNAFNLPWESIPILRNHPVTRLPSVISLTAHLEKYARMLKCDKGFYIVNPTADLVDTQKRFDEFFGQRRLTAWEGVSGSVPSKEQIMAALDDRDLILYMGHGCGDSVINLHLQISPATSANMFLIGCSSVRLQHGTLMDGNAFFYKCLMMGSPCVLGNLWMVTSGCIDMMMSSLLTDLLETRKKPRKGQDDYEDKWFQDLVAISRERTRSNFLVGAAPVVIGLPMVY